MKYSEAVERLLRDMATRKDPDVTPGAGRIHAVIALSPGVVRGMGENPDETGQDVERIRASAIAYHREQLADALPGSIAESTAEYALRLLGAEVSP